MVAFNSASVNRFRRRGDIARDGFDRDIAIEGPPRRLFEQTVSKCDVIDIWSDTDTTAGRRSLASRGATFTPLHHEERGDAANSNKTLIVSSSSSTSPSESKRRWDLKASAVRMLRHGLKENERGPSVCGCGHAAYDKDEKGTRTEVTIHRNGKSRAWVSGVYRCKHAWLCPTCATAVAKRRQTNVQRVVEATVERTGHFVMGLVTLSHGKKDRLADLKKMLTESFAAARRGAPWERIKTRAMIAGVLVAVEVTHGDHGWHIHIHFGMPCLSGSEAEAMDAGRILVERFRRQIAARGGKTSTKGQGWQIAASPEAAGEYIAKGASWELAGNAHKDEGDGDTIWDIVDDADQGDVDAFARFKEYAEVMPGTRSCIVTKPMREKLGLDADDVPDVPGEQDFDDAGAVVGHVPSYIWHRFLRMKMAGTFLSRIESISGDVAFDVFECIVAETTADADKAEGVITLKRARKVQTSAADVAAGNAATRVMLARNIAYRIQSAQALGNVHEIIAARIETFRNEGHPDAALPSASDVVKEIARLDREASERAIAA